jgi:3-hydroxyisobutyrate dehydrogenase-like beta-hydroxyacid dehydrogenase
MTAPVGFVGLGNMGSALAANLVGAGFDVVAHDVAGPERAPEGALFTDRLEGVADRCAIVVFSLPDGPVSEKVTQGLAASAAPGVTHVIDTSTIGVAAAERNAAVLARAGIAYVDAPVSGGVAGARARTLTVMYAGPDTACAEVLSVIEGLSDRRVRVGDRAGLAQAMKLANNFLSATTLAATSEAIAFGTRAGLSMDTMLEVLNAASGQSAATSDKFPNHVLTGRYAAGFANHLMAKDVDLYLDAVAEQHGPRELGGVVAALWRRFADGEPGADFTRIYPFTQGSAALR